MQQHQVDQGTMADIYSLHLLNMCMSVIVELALPPTEFQLGRILSVDSTATITLKTMVPLGTQAVPLFQVVGETDESFQSDIKAHEVVSDINVVNEHDDTVLYALDWNVATDTFLDRIRSHGGHLLEAAGGQDSWSMEIRFPSHDTLGAFQADCRDTQTPIDITRIFNPTKPDAGPWYGLTAPQRETLMFAVEQGYYSLPREASTVAVADEFDISDQAATERLRRAIDTLVSNTLELTATGDG